MFGRSLLLVLLSLTGALVPSARAQFGKIELTGIVEKLDQAPPCFAKATHRVKCTEIYLVAGQGVDLAKWQNAPAQIEGVLQLALCVALRVDKIEKPAHYLTIQPAPFNQPRLGDLMTWTTRAPTLAIVPLTFGNRPGFVPLPGFGTLQIDPLTIYVHTFNVALIGISLDLIRIPNDPKLVGALIRNQGSYIDMSNPQEPVFRLLNVDCFRIQAR